MLYFQVRARKKSVWNERWIIYFAEKQGVCIWECLFYAVPGVVTNGIFAINKADIAIVATNNGIEERTAV